MIVMKQMDGNCVDYSKNITLLAEDCNGLKLVLDKINNNKLLTRYK